MRATIYVYISMMKIFKTMKTSKIRHIGIFDFANGGVLCYSPRGRETFFNSER